MNFLLKALSILVMTTMTGVLDNGQLLNNGQISSKKNDNTQQDTIYIDKDKKQVATDDIDLSNIDSKEIVQIGFFENGDHEIQVVKMPRVIEKVPNKLPLAITSLKDMFNGCIFFNQDLSSWDTTNVIDMTNTFKGARLFNQNISSWNTTNVVKMSGMFADVILFNQDISSWITSNVIYMNAMFAGAKSFNQNLSWDIVKVKDMSSMFYDAIAFNGNFTSLSHDNSVINISNMFRNAIAFNQDLSNWNVKKVQWHGWFATYSAFAHDTKKWPKFIC